MEITIFIPPELEHLVGETPEAIALAVQALVDKELTRLWHIERCKPKPKQSKRDPVVERELRRLEAEGDRVFSALRRHAGEDFERAYGVYLEQFKGLVRGGNLLALEDFLGRKPWLRR